MWLWNLRGQTHGLGEWQNQRTVQIDPLLSNPLQVHCISVNSTHNFMERIK